MSGGAGVRRTFTGTAVCNPMPFVSTAEPSVVCLINFVGPRRVRIDFDNTNLLAMIMPLSERLISGLRNVNWSFLPQPAGIHWSKYHNRHRVLHAFWIPTQAKFRDRGRDARGPGTSLARKP